MFSCWMTFTEFSDFFCDIQKYFLQIVGQLLHQCYLSLSVHILFMHCVERTGGTRLGMYGCHAY